MSKNKAGYINTKELAREAALEALREFKKEEKEKVKKTRLHNTGLLLEHYIELLDHYENIKYRASDIQEDLDPDELSAVDMDDITIYSIKRSKIRTKIMIRQIETAVEMLKAEMQNKKQVEKYEVIHKLYMERDKKDVKFTQRVKIVADEMMKIGMPCSESSVRRWANEMLNELSVKLFGVDGLRLDI